MGKARILIVEDEILVAADLEARLEDAGFDSIGIAADMPTAISLANGKPDLALVDIHLRDGPTGVSVGRTLTEAGVCVLFVTANPRMALDGGRVGLGVLSKPCEDKVLQAALSYALMARHDSSASPPAGLTLLTA